MFLFKPYIYIGLGLLVAIAACKTPELNQTTVLDANAIIRIMPASIDTTNIVVDNTGNSLTFRQYIPIVFNGEGMIYRDRETFRLQRFTKTAIYSLERTDYPIAGIYRWDGIRAKDIPKTNEAKFSDLAATFSTADRIVVYKAKRTMLLQRKGKVFIRFNINLGHNPIGDKVMERDNKTPEGVYYVDNKFTRNDKYYKSFWISYPNSANSAIALKRNVKPGIGVMIHGTPPARANSRDWTNGCIALKNTDMDTLFKYVIPGTIIDIRK